MEEHVVDELYGYTAGHLSAQEVSRVEAHLRLCGQCRKEADELDALTEQLASAPRGVLLKLESNLQGVGRFEHLLPRVAQLFDLTVDEVRAVLQQAEDPAAWETELYPGVHALPVTAGPKAAAGDAFTVLLRIQPGAEFPKHTHGGEEQVLILEGGYVDVSGREYWRGELDVRAKGTTHSFVALAGLSCLCAARTYPNEVTEE